MTIDQSSNGGGGFLLWYDAFRQFFPQIIQDGFARLREHEGAIIASVGISRYPAYSPLHQ
jgi:hypothetical protein